MHWQDAIRQSNVDLAVRTYHKDREIVRKADGSGFIRYKNTGILVRFLNKLDRIEGYLDWEPINRGG